MRIAFAGGGTGGHVFPVQSLIKYIRKYYPGQYDLFWFGEKPSLEWKIYQKLVEQFLIDDAYLVTSLPHQKDSIKNLGSRMFLFFRVFSGKRRREKEFLAILKNIFGIFVLFAGVVLSLFYLIKYKIDKIFCKGGYVSLPVVIAAWILRKPVLLHESDTKPGLANRICSKFATTIFTGFGNVFPGREIVVGQILDDDLISNITAVNKQDKTDILVIGGSQGSQSLYDMLYELLLTNQAKLQHTHFHIVLGTENQAYLDRFTAFDFVTVYPFVDQQEMGNLLVKCDLSITRGGTTSLAEQELFGIKKIIIPIPWTHDQLKNAQYFVKECGDILIEQLSPEFKSQFKETVLQYATYLKQPYTDPRDSIRKPKEIIVGYLVR